MNQIVHPREARPVAGERAFRLAMRALAGGVTIVALQDAAGNSHGLTATAICSLSDRPPSLLVCINLTSGVGGALVPGGVFSVNLPGPDQTDVAEAFAGMRGVRGGGKFLYGAWRRGESGAPLLGGARIAFECVATETLPRATHLVVIGTVMDVHTDAPDRPALVWHHGAFRSVE